MNARIRNGQRARRAGAIQPAGSYRAGLLLILRAVYPEKVVPDEKVHVTRSTHFAVGFFRVYAHVH